MNAKFTAKFVTIDNKVTYWNGQTFLHSGLREDSYYTDLKNLLADLTTFITSNNKSIIPNMTIHQHKEVAGGKRITTSVPFKKVVELYGTKYQKNQFV